MNKAKKITEIDALIAAYSSLKAINMDDESGFNKDQAFQHFLERTINATEGIQKKPRFKLYFLRIAASVTLLIATSAIGYWFGTNKINNLTENLISVEAPFSSRSKMYLPDGTLVWLNAGSKITYAQNFGVKNRKITLVEGEAYFEVTKNDRIPFDITAQDLSVRVFGTKFNFRNYSDEDEESVTLLEGKVNVKNASDNKSGYLLFPNQKVIYDKAGKRMRLIDVKAKNSSAWTEGIIFFDEERLPDIVRELERLYDVKIELADKELYNYRFYGTFIRTEQTIQEVLNVFASTEKLKYIINGKEVRIFTNKIK